MTDEGFDPAALGELDTTEGTVLAGIHIDDSPGPARRMSQAQAAALIDAALDGWSVAAPVAAPRPRPRLRIATVAAIAAALAAGTALAWYVATGAPPDQTFVLPPAPPPATPEPPPTPVEAPIVAAPVVDEPQVATPEAEAPVVEAPIEEPAEETRSERTRRATRSASAPDDLLREANELRAARRWADAERLYTRVARESAPTTSAGYVALVAAGGLRLDHLGDPRGALTAYRSARSAQPHGVLDVEARAGIARAHRRLGDRAREREALRELITAYPDEPAAERARTRLAELEAE